MVDLHTLIKDSLGYKTRDYAIALLKFKITLINEIWILNKLFGNKLKHLENALILAEEDLKEYVNSFYEE